MLFAKSVVTSDVGAGKVTAEFEQSIVHSGASSGAGAGGPCATPPSPSANATAEMEATRRKVAKKRASFFIFFSFLRGYRWNRLPATPDCVDSQA